MKIIPVSIYLTDKYNQTSTNYQNNNIRLSNPNDSVSFTSYKSKMANFFLRNITTEKQAEIIFSNLFKLIKEDKNILKTSDFNVIQETLHQKGFRGLMQELCSANPSENIARLTEKLIQEQKSHTLAEQNGQPIFELFNFGKNGFFDELTDNPLAGNDIRVLFSDGLNRSILNFEFSMDKNDNIILDQYRNGISVYTTFHRETGNRKKQIVSGLGFPETTYYKKNGKKSFWQNFLHGGVAVPTF